MAHSLAANGARKVYILGRRLETLEQCASSSPLGSIVPVQCDITSKEEIEKAAARVSDEIGHINLLVLNAGVPGPRSAVLPKNSSVDEFVADQWRISMDEYVEPFRTHDAASWFTAMGFLRLLDAGNRDDSVVQLSQIIIVSSAGAFNRATLGNFAYAQSKSGQIHMMKQLATVLVPYKIRANAICPGGEATLLDHHNNSKVELELTCPSVSLRFERMDEQIRGPEFSKLPCRKVRRGEGHGRGNTLSRQ